MSHPSTIDRTSSQLPSTRFALIGILVGFIGLGLATFRMSVESEPPPPPKTKEISDVLSDTVKKTVDKLRKKPVEDVEMTAPAKIEWPLSKKLGIAATLCGFVSALMGCVSWLAHERRRWTWTALVVGVAAMAWTHVVVAAAIAVGIAILVHCV